MKVWVVSKGAYSDRHVVAVFDDEAKANELVEALRLAGVDGYGDDNGSVEEFEIDTVVPKVYRFEVFIRLSDGEVTEVRDGDWVESEASAHESYCLAPVPIVFGRGLDREEAVKNASAWRAALLGTYGSIDGVQQACRDGHISHGDN